MPHDFSNRNLENRYYFIIQIGMGAGALPNSPIFCIAREILWDRPLLADL